jgi:hypothetical protein
MIYVIFTFAFALVCFAGLEFVYLMIMEKTNRELRRRIKVVESRNRRLNSELNLLKVEHESRDERVNFDQDELWPEVISDDRRRK